MVVREWIVETPERHVVRLEHGQWTGWVKLSVDDALVYDRPRKLLDWGLSREFVVDNVPFVVRIRAEGLTFKYGCQVADDHGQVCRSCGEPFARGTLRCPLCGGEGQRVRVLVNV